MARADVMRSCETDRQSQHCIGRRDMTAAPVSAPPGMVWIPGGTFQMGSEDFYAEERPVRDMAVEGFWMDEHPVTVAEYRRFVKATGYVTLAEQAPDPALYPDADPAQLVPGSLVFRPTRGPVSLEDYRVWWAFVPGACWRRPEGQGSDTYMRARHPVVHVAHQDALAYACWAGRALPTEAEWERAARGGREGALYPWGDEPPWEKSYFGCDSKTGGPAHIGVNEPNDFGLYDMSEGVHEWCSDYYDYHYYRYSPERNPPGPSAGQRRASRGGSWRHRIKFSR